LAGDDPVPENLKLQLSVARAVHGVNITSLMLLFTAGSSTQISSTNMNVLMKWLYHDLQSKLCIQRRRNHSTAPVGCHHFLAETVRLWQKVRYGKTPVVIYRYTQSFGNL